jgi:transposase-like protein
MIRRGQNGSNLMVGGKHHFLISILTRLRLRKRQKRAVCPSCHSDNTELVNQIDDGEGYWKKEEYVCNDCDCEWDWTYQRPFFHWRVRIRAPGWMKIE